MNTVTTQFAVSEIQFTKPLFRFQVARRLMHRPMLVYRILGLVIIDGIPVSDDERTKADLYFIEQQVHCQFYYLTLLVMFTWKQLQMVCIIGLLFKILLMCATSELSTINIGQEIRRVHKFV